MHRSKLPGVTALAFALALGVAPHGASAQACPAPTATANPHPVAIVAPHATLEVRVAATPPVQAYGLMCVRDLPPHTGMIFVFSDGDQRRSFWMKNTLVPLDMVFVRRGGTVESVAANVPATTVSTPEIDVPWRYGNGSYVIELPAGEAAPDGIAAGTRLDLSNVTRAVSAR